MGKFYSQYKPGSKIKKSCDSLYQLIEKRRTAFSKSFRAYKEEKGSLEGFVYDWADDEKEILPSFKSVQNLTVKYLLYYSYFDLGYGAYGLHLNSEICKKGITEIPSSSAVWAMEPSLLDPVILAAGGEDMNVTFIKQILKNNRDKNLVGYVSNNLSPDRALKKGKIIPSLQYRDLTDSTKILSVDNLRGKHYLIDIWVTWCKPCIDEFPGLINTYNVVKGADIEFISISIDDNSHIIQEFLQNKMSLPWQVVLATSRKELMNKLMINGIPCTILIDSNGRILSYGNELRGTSLVRTLKAFLK